MAVLVVAGKGGVGKTSTVAGLVRLAQARRQEFVVIDADPVGQLGALLGAPRAMTVAEAADAGLLGDSEGLASQDVDALLRRLPEGGATIAMGHPRSEGCFCRANALTRAVMGLVLNRFPLVIMDSEAGVEHITRGTGRHATRLVLMGDASRASLAVAADILETVRSLGADGHSRVNGTVHLGVLLRVPGMAQPVSTGALSLGLPRPRILPHSVVIAVSNLAGDAFPAFDAQDPFFAALHAWADEDSLLTVLDKEPEVAA